MKELKEILKVADNLIKLVPDKEHRDYLKVYKRCIKKRKYNTARILADELVDYFDKKEDVICSTQSKELYDKTIELIELVY